MKKLFILDGSGFLYRAYYAFPAMMNTEGKNRNVVYGFFRMLLKIFLEKPDYFVIARDSPVKTHRHTEYAEYKANRKKMEDEFKQQIPLVRTIVEELKIPHLTMPGYEADDIIASLANLYNNQIHIDIYSSDKDLKQLLDTHIYEVDPMKNETSTVESFIKEFQFAPHQMGDYLSLIGDASDNIPGVPGIGPKKATDLLMTYHTLDNIYANLEKLPEDLRQKLEEGKESAFQSKSLVNLKLIPELDSQLLEKLKLSIDFDQMKKVLVQDHHFPSFGKTIDETKKKLAAPVQMGLFG